VGAWRGGKGGAAGWARAWPCRGWRTGDCIAGKPAWVIGCELTRSSRAQARGKAVSSNHNTAGEDDDPSDPSYEE